MLLDANDLWFRFRPTERWLFAGLSMSASSSELYAVTGPSGCGKSTLLDLLGALRQPDAGEVALRDRDGSRSYDAHQVSWIAQSSPVLGGRTALDNVAIAMLSTGVSMGEARAAACTSLSSVGLSHRADARVRDLSGGEVQRLSIARCLSTSAPVILADEPTGQLDSRNTKEVVGALRSAASQGKVVVVATHDAWVMDQCDARIDLRDSRAYE